MKYSIIEGSFATVFIALSTGAFLTGYALMLGANEFIIGLIGAIPFLSQVMQILGFYLLRKYKSPQKISIVASIFNRWVWVILVALPFLDFSPEIKISIFLLVLFVSFASGSVLANVWTTWIGEIVPKNIWGKYFGKRSAYNNIVNIIVFFASAFALDALRRIDLRVGYLVITSICFLSGAITTFLFKYHPDVKFEFREEISLRDEVLSPLKDKSFRDFVLFFLYWNFAVGFSAPFMAFHMLENLKVDFSTIAVFNMLTMSLNVVLSQWWGKMIDKFGAKNVLMFNASNIAYIPILWLVARSNFLLPLYLDAIMVGIAWSGFNLAAFNIPLSKAPKKSRSIYVAVLSIFSGFGYLSASVLAGYIATLLKDFSVEIFEIKFINLHVLFLSSFVLRTLGVVFLIRIPESGSKSFLEMLDLISTSISRIFFSTGGVTASSDSDEK